MRSACLGLARKTTPNLEIMLSLKSRYPSEVSIIRRHFKLCMLTVADSHGIQREVGVKSVAPSTAKTASATVAYGVAVVAYDNTINLTEAIFRCAVASL